MRSQGAASVNAKGEPECMWRRGVITNRLSMHGSAETNKLDLCTKSTICPWVTEMLTQLSAGPNSTIGDGGLTTINMNGAGG